MKEKFVKAYMDTAHRFAQLSTAKRLQVGAIIVKDDRIISIGYNGMPSGWDNVCEHQVYANEFGREKSYTKSRPEVLHAEANAITKVARSSESSKGATLFCTHTPCIECAKLIYQSGIDTVYVDTEYVASKGSGKQFLIDCGVEVIKYDNAM
jgi:dCMP deaminase